jgi:hypothetical protein
MTDTKREKFDEIAGEIRHLWQEDLQPVKLHRLINELTPDGMNRICSAIRAALDGGAVSQDVQIALDAYLACQSPSAYECMSQALAALRQPQPSQPEPQSHWEAYRQGKHDFAQPQPSRERDRDLLTRFHQNFRLSFRWGDLTEETIDKFLSDFNQSRSGGK